MAIILTEKAAAEIQRVRDEQKLEEEQFLRIGVSGGGCSGFSYTMGFDKTYDSQSDSKYNMHGVDLVVDLIKTFITRVFVQQRLERIVHFQFDMKAVCERQDQGLEDLPEIRRNGEFVFVGLLPVF